MRTTIRSLLAISALLLSLAAARPVRAITIQFEAIDLTAPGPGGGDLWQYLYHVSDFTPLANVAFETLFDPALYSELQDPPPQAPDWDIITIQPDLGIPDPGRYSALALIDGAALSQPFTLTFVWLGGPGSTPGTQPFEVVEFDDGGNFLHTLDAGQTAAVPEPGTLALLGTGLAGLGWLRRRRG